eukprot:749049-Hanusia_phi.AAC.6
MGCGASRPVATEDEEGWRPEQSFSRKNGEDSASSSDLDLKRRKSTPVKKMIAVNLRKRMSMFSRSEEDDEDDWYQRSASHVFSPSLTDFGASFRAMENRSRANDSVFVPLLKENARSLLNFTLVAGNHPALLKLPRALENVVKPKLEMRQFKSHTMDNVKVRRMCDELLSLEDPSYKMSESNINKKIDDAAWLKTLSIGICCNTSCKYLILSQARGGHVHGIQLSCNPEISIGGYFIISQMLSYIQSLLFLDVSQNNLTAAEARVLSLGLRLNCSVQELRMKDNRIGASGATSLSEALRVNRTLLVLDLRGNNIRGPGICMLADSMQDNMTLTDMDLRWNYTGESSDYVESALIDLNKFCERNLKSAIEEDLSEDPTSRQKGVFTASQSSSDVMINAETQISKIPAENGVINNDNSNTSNGTNGTEDVTESGLKITGERRTIRQIDNTFRTGSVSSLGLPKMDDGPAAKIVVEVFSAKNLPPVMWSTGKDDEIPGMPHAYCICSLNKEQHPSEISKKDYNPCWNFSCSFNVYNMWNVLVVKIAHTPSTIKRHRDDYIIGTVNIPIGWVVNWRGVTKGLDGLYRAFYRSVGASTGTVYQSCTSLDSNGVETSFFHTPEAAAHAYDEVAFKKDGERAQQNFSSDSDVIGLHVKEESFHLVGEDGVEVVGVQAGVISTLRIRLKMFFTGVNYLEILLDRSSSLPPRLLC